MVDSIESLSEVQEEHPTHPPIVHLVKDIGQEVDETGSGGVTLPEPRLARAQDTIFCAIIIQLSVDNSLHYFANAG